MKPVLVRACSSAEYVVQVEPHFRLEGIRVKTTKQRGELLITRVAIDDGWRVHVGLANSGTFDRFVSVELDGVTCH